jgi:hypothetical protein
MAKRSDRVFHLTVSAFALTLTLLSAGTILYQRDPQRVRTWLESFTGKSLVHLPKVKPAPASPVTKPRAASPKIQAQTQQTQGMIRLQAYNRDVPNARLTSVEDLLSKYNVASTVTNSLQLQFKRPVHIYLAQNSQDYKEALASLGVSAADARRFTLDTGGFTQGNAIVIPLYQNKTQADLANTLAHELTHALFNVNIHATIPSWINEGLAVYNGMAVQSKVEDTVAYNGYAKQMAESIIKTAAAGKLIPLTNNESKVLSGTESYDLELQDWLAVSFLIHEHGYASFVDYLRRINSGVDVPSAFEDVFHMTPVSFNSLFTKNLQKSADVKDSGVVIMLSVPATYHGNVRILQHGTVVWSGFKAEPGQVTLSVTPEGKLSGPHALVAPIHDSNPGDPNTVYIDLQPTGSLTYKGHAVANCGFAIDYHYGMYGYVNSWITYKNGQSIYLQAPSLFGLRIASIHAVGPDNPLTSTLRPL